MSNVKRAKVAHNSDKKKQAEQPSVSIIDLPNDVLKHCFSFIPGQYISVGPVCKHFYRNYSTVGIDDSMLVLSTEVLFKIGQNRRTTADAVASAIDLTEYAFVNNAPQDFMSRVYCKAAMKGRKDILECANIFGLPLKEITENDSTVREKELIVRVVEEGNLEMLKYVDKFCAGISSLGLHNIYRLAKEKKHLHILEWIILEKKEELPFGGDHHVSTFKALRYLQGKSNPMEKNPDLTRNLFSEAAKIGDIEMMEYCHNKNCPVPFDIYSDALINEDKASALKTLKWLHQYDYPLEASACATAAKSDNLEALKWARDNGCPWDGETLAFSSLNGNFEMIDYCIQNDCPIDTSACYYAMKNDSDAKALETLKYLRQHSCPWDEHTCGDAALNGNVNTLLWAKRNGCPFTVESFYKVVMCGHPSVIEEVLRDEEYDFSDASFREETFIAAFETDNVSLVIEKLKLLNKYGCQWSASTSRDAAMYGKLRVLQWLRYKGCSLDKDTCTGAVRSGKIEIIKYVHENAGCELSKEAYAFCIHVEGLDAFILPDRIPRKVRSTHDEILAYLVHRDCPKIEDSDWNVARRVSLPLTRLPE
ncbi:hypothetical protein CTEN210_11517 [Chaetoceros tenuissimus]|uniref:Uncharacterized protein n=1 Tax=Chaetoceros tenuissimus TaxID=426638 RepID=A0AAD3D1G8_9STRA|nr:hypothetical protein CTEN210_11517 [Chaetoceros tenuissimus]